MSAPKHPQLEAADDAWRHHEPRIRSLYLEQKKTLQQVKNEMETDYNFPIKYSLSEWEIHLRDVLGLRKKMKKKDWRVVYQHYKHRQDQGKESAVYLRNYRIEKKRAWREMRRNGALRCSPCQGSPSPLPYGVSVRTPSPILSSRRTMTPPPDFTRPIFDSTAAVSNCNTAQGSQVIAANLQSILRKDGTLRQHIVTVPFIQLMRNLIPASSNIPLSLQGELGTMFTVRLGFEFLLSSIISNESPEQRSATHLPSRLPGQLRPADTGALSQNHDAFYLLAVLIYTFSNGLEHKLHGYSARNSTQSDILETILEHVPRRLLFALFQGRSPSIRAAWEKLLEYVHQVRKLRWQSTMRSLLQVGIHNNWFSLPDYGHFYLSCACKIADFELLQRLWTHGCRPHCGWKALRPLSRMRSEPLTIAVVESLYRGSVECAQFIIEHLEESDLANNFNVFLEKIDPLNANIMAGLDIFLRNGAPVDSVIPHDDFHPEATCYGGRYGTLSRLWDLYDSVTEAHRLSMLDYYFYFDREIFQKMAPHSRVPPHEVTRSGIISALEVDVDCLHDYLSHFSSAAASRDLSLLLEVIFAEQVLLWGVFGEGTKDHPHPIHGWRRIQLHVLQGLLDFGVDASLPSLPDTGPQELLTTAIENESSDTMGILQLLFENGAIGDAYALESAVERGDVEVLRYIASLVCDIRIQTKVLATAIAYDDREAVQVLLDAGVDPTADLVSPRALRQERHISAVAEAVECGMGPHRDVQLSQAMMECLLERGIEFKVGKYDHGPFEFIRHLIINASQCEVFEPVEYILTATDSLDDVRYSEVDLLGAISRSINTSGATLRHFWGTDKRVRLDRLRLLQYLFRLGAHVRPPTALESPLVVLAVLDGPEELIDEVLKAGADIQSYGLGFFNSILTPLQVAAHDGNKALLEFLLKNGADVNQMAYCAGSRRGLGGATALQGICAWDPATSAESVTRMEIIEHLLDLGADVNAAPGATMGYTALQIVARMGDLEVATLLVHLGADVNAPRGRWRGKAALDGATVTGRLDMVKFLLTAGAVSHDRGETGYDGAIRKAKKHGYFAIADLIQQHVADNARSGFNPSIELPYRDYHEYDYRNTDSESVLSDGAGSEAAVTTADSDPAQPSGTGEPSEDYSADIALLDDMQDTAGYTKLSEQHIERRDMATISGSFNNSMGEKMASEEFWVSDWMASASMESARRPEDAMAQDQDEQHMNISSAMIFDNNVFAGWPYPQDDVMSQEQLEQQMDLDWGYGLDNSMCIGSTGSQGNAIPQAQLEQQMEGHWISRLEALDAEAWEWNNG